VTVTFTPALVVPDDGDRYVTPSLIRRYEAVLWTLLAADALLGMHAQ